MAVVVSLGLAALGWVASPLVAKLLNEGFASLGINAEENLQELSDTVLPVLKSVIEEAEGSENRKKVEKWLQRLKDAYDGAEDALDLFNYHSLRRKVAAERRSERRTNRVHFSFRVLRHLKSIMPVLKDCRDMLSPRKIKLQRKLNKLKKIASEEAVTLRAELRAQPDRTVAVTDSRDTSSQSPPKVYGRDKDRKEIIRLLKMKPAAATRKPGLSDIPIIAIVGRPGIGKTTLAQYVCEKLNSEGFYRHFHPIIWAYASRNFNKSKIMKDIIKQTSIITGRRDHDNLGTIDDSEEVLRLKMKKMLSGKKFLLVIDDVWCDTEEDKTKWKTLFRYLSKCLGGSKILVITQTDNAPIKIGVTGENIYSLVELEENDCLNLFIHHAFPSEENNSDLTEELKRKCEAITPKLNKDPTVIKMVGNTIATKVAELRRLQRDWRTYLSTIEQKDWSGHKNIALMWSYLHLPAHLQRCFSYCSLYPRGHKFKDLELIKLWMAQGFIKPDDQNARMEDVGNDYLNELVSKFYIQSHERYYTLCELLYDLAEKVSSGVCLRFEEGQIPATIRHLCIPADKLNEKREDICKLKKLRTLIVTKGEREYVATDVFKILKKLRVLVLELYLENLAEFISEMKHLRILRVSDTREFVLPESVCTLYLLLVLEAENASSLPKFLTNLVNLKYLQAKFDIISAIPDIGKLTSLQGLDNFQVRKEAGDEQEQLQTFNAPRAHMRIGRHENAAALMGAASAIAGHELEQLQNMNELRGRLRIANLENVESKESAIAAKLEEKKYLDALELAWSDGEDNVNSNLDVEILEGLQLPPNLTSLHLDGYRGQLLPSWPERQTSYIQKLVLRQCKMLEELPPMDQIFPSCRSLELSHLSKLKALHALPPQLTTLTIKNTPALTSLVGIGSLPHLKELYLSGFPCLVKETAFLPSLLEIITFESCADVDVILDNADLSCLSDLTITRCQMRTASLQFGILQSLRSLDILDCPGSFSVDLQGRHTLEIIILRNCSNLKAVKNFPKSFTSLEIHGCPILEKRFINVDPHSGVRMLGDIPIEDSFEDDL